MGFVRQNFVRIEVSISPDLHKRLKTICKQQNLKLIELARDAIAERVEFLEEKRRKEEERLRAEREASGGRTKFAGFRRMSKSSLPPVAKPTPLGEKPAAPEPAPVAKAPAEPPKELPIEYGQYAQKIFTALAGGSTLEVRLCTLEALTAIKKRYPLTHPKDEIIVASLERLVSEMRESAAAARVEEPEIVIDTSKVRTFGSVPASEGDA